jgi:DNA-binding CsgD family transcriptional regulator
MTSASRPSGFTAAVHGYLDRALVLEEAGDPAAAAQAALEGRVEAERHGLSGTLGALISAVAARDLLRTGDWVEAARLLGPGPDERATVLPEVALVRALLATWRGDWSAAEADLDIARAAGAIDQVGWPRFADLVEAELACWRRRFAEARSAVWRGLESSQGDAARTSLAHLALLGIRIEADALAASSRRSAALATPAEESATADWIALRTLLEQPSEAPAHGPRDAALLTAGAAELGRLGGPGDSDAWRRAVDAWDAAGDRFAAAYSRWRLAEALLAAGGHRGHARRALQDGLAAADELGAAPLAREIERLARRARLSGLGGEQRPALLSQSAGQAEARRLGLSEREVEVLELLAEGLPDRDIAERLFISTKTAGHHVSHVLTKLGVDRRGEAAAIAFRIGLVPPGA